MQWLTPEQFYGWLEYEQLEPWGFPIDDLWFGILNSTVGAAAGAKGLKHDTFMVGPTLDQREPSAADVETQLDHLLKVKLP